MHSAIINKDTALLDKANPHRRHAIFFAELDEDPDTMDGLLALIYAQEALTDTAEMLQDNPHQRAMAVIKLASKYRATNILQMADQAGINTICQGGLLGETDQSVAWLKFAADLPLPDSLPHLERQITQQIKDTPAERRPAVLDALETDASVSPAYMSSLIRIMHGLAAKDGVPTLYHYKHAWPRLLAAFKPVPGGIWDGWSAPLHRQILLALVSADQFTQDNANTVFCPA